MDKEQGEQRGERQSQQSCEEVFGLRTTILSKELNGYTLKSNVGIVLNTLTEPMCLWGRPGMQNQLSTTVKGCCVHSRIRARVPNTMQCPNRRLTLEEPLNPKIYNSLSKKDNHFNTFSDQNEEQLKLRSDCFTYTALICNLGKSDMF